MTGAPYESSWGYTSQAKRIREERIRLGFANSPSGEKEFCQKYQINRNRLRVLETENDLKTLNRKMTIDELRALAYSGMDISYLLTGVRSAVLTKEEQSLLDNYRACSDSDKTHIKAVGTAFAQSKPENEDRVVV